jgi:hypothetical protein
MDPDQAGRLAARIDTCNRAIARLTVLPDHGEHQDLIDDIVELRDDLQKQLDGHRTSGG